jgi:hypothetical protein
MARKKKADTVLHNDKKMETVIDFGDIKVPTKWEEVTLQMLTDYLTLSHEKEEALKKDKFEAKKNNQEAPNEKDEKYNLTDKDILRIFTNFDISKYDILPVELYEAIMSNFSFLIEDMPQMKPSKELFFKNVHFVINDMEALKVKEYEDADMVMRNNQYDYPSLLSILCRECKGRKTDHITGQTYLINEDYDTEFANHIFDARREMFANMPITQTMPLISFFLLKGLESNSHFQNSIQTLALQLKEAVENMLDSIKSMGSRRWLYLPQTIKLKKYRKSINSILQSS